MVDDYFYPDIRIQSAELSERMESEPDQWVSIGGELYAFHSGNRDVVCRLDNSIPGSAAFFPLKQQPQISAMARFAPNANFQLNDQTNFNFALGTARSIQKL